MTAWFGDNWWWVLPIALFPVVIWSVTTSHRKAVQASGGGWKSHIDAAAKTILGMFALLLGYSAFAQGWFIGIVPSVLMVWILHVPARGGYTLPNWTRYVGYSTLLVAFVAFFPLSR